MKKIILTALLATFAVIASSALESRNLRIYINPGHGSWTTNDRPFALIDHGSYRTSTGEVDTLRFFESNTNLEKAFGVMEKLIEYGVPFDRTRNQSNSVPTRVGAALDLRQNIVLSRVKNGPFPVTSDANYSGGYNRSLSEIAIEVEQNNFDMFLSIHSNGNNTSTNTTENYLLMLFRGEGSNSANWRDEVPNSVRMAQACWKYAIANTHQQWSSGLNAEIIRGDWTFYGSHSVSTNGCDGYLGVLKHHVPGFLAEGYFHTYGPGRHRAMNWDVDRSEGVAYARGIADYFGFNNETTGDILGIVRDLEKEIKDYLYAPCTGVDKFHPINGCVVSLKKDGQQVATYTTDNRYNGAFYFPRLAPGKYALSFSHPDYDALEQDFEVEVKAGATAYPSVQLKNPNYDPNVPGGGKKQVAAAFASELKATDNGSSYTIEFLSNAAGDAARLIAANADNEEEAIDLGAVVKGLNQFNIEKSSLPAGNCTWSIEITSPLAENSYCYYSENNGNLVSAARGGAWMVTDPESDFFGHLYVGYGWISEISELSADLKELDRLDASWIKKSNGYSPTRLSYANDRIYMTDFSDGNSGIYFLDLNDRRSGTQSMFETSTRDSNGALYANGKIVGGSTSHVAFTGSGDQTVMWCFPEDYPSSDAATDAAHVIRGWKVGMAKKITGVPDYEKPKNGIANCWNYIIPTEGGMWVSQKRSAGNNTASYPGVIYMDNDGKVLYSSHVIASSMPTSGGSIALSADNTKMAVDQGSDGIYIYDVTWSGDTPSLKLNEQVPGSESDLDAECYPQLQFDPAGNLIAFKRGSGLQLYAMKSATPRVSVVAAKKAETISGSSSGLNTIVSDEDTAPAVYYNLQGVRVDNPANGVFIEVRGTKAVKVVK